MNYDELILSGGGVHANRAPSVRILPDTRSVNPQFRDNLSVVTVNVDLKSCYLEANEKTKIIKWYTNATSLNNKIDELRLLLNIHKPDVVCVTETWFKLESDVKINSYNIFRLDGPTHGGSVCIYVKNNITSNESNIDRLNKIDIEHIWACLCFGELLIGCIYRPPGLSSTVNNLMIESIVSAKKSIYQRLYSDIVISGDFNFNTIDASDRDCRYVSGDAHAQSFIDCLDECFLTNM